jgi:Abortive infection alpha
MADELDDGELSVNVSELQFTVRGRAYEDLRPIIKTSTATITNVLEVLENAVGVSCDFANHHLKRFRSKYQSGVKKIPSQFRELPPFRLGCLVIREVVFAAEEPELQSAFAQLLLSATDTRTRDSAFPGFATTLGQLSAFDTDLLSQLRAHQWRVRMEDIVRIMDGQKDVTEFAFHNLRRSGIADWWHLEPNPFFPEQISNNFARDVDADTFRRSSPMHGLIELNLTDGLASATKNLGFHIVELLKQTQNPFGIKATPYGEQFVQMCFGTIADEAKAAPVQRA